MISTYILIGIIVLQAILHHFERKDLYNRIMSKTLSEYKGENDRSPKSAHKAVMDAWRGKGGESK